MNVGPAEVLVILVVALIVFGPKRLPEVGRQIGSAMRELRRMQDTVKSEIDGVLHPNGSSADGAHGETAALPPSATPAVEEPDHTTMPELPTPDAPAHIDDEPGSFT